MLEVVNVSINYGDVRVLRDISFSLKAGEIIAVVGANGAGKTTLLKGLNFTVPLIKGDILLNGKPIEQFSRREIAKRIAVVAQENETKFPITVLEFVLAGRFAHGGAFGWETEKGRRIASNCLKLCNLENYEKRLMNKLSGGERQRALLARAMAAETQILFLDEPTNNLDLSHQSSIFRLVKERTKNCASAAIVITHDLNLASEFADRILLLEDRKILAQGTPREVLTEEILYQVFGIKVLLDTNPVTKNVRVTAIYAEKRLF